jgi:hypothetical protein
MKKIAIRSIAAFALIASVGISVPAVAFASSSTPSTGATTTTAWTTWHATWVTYVQGLKSINATHRSSMQGARTTLQAALAAATSKAEKHAAIAAFQVSVEAALNARVTAITAAGDPPPPPAGYNGTTYVDGIQSANIAFRASVTAAQTALSAALASATTGQEARTAHLTYEQTVGTAIVTRSTALLALGAPPADPGQLS